MRGGISYFKAIYKLKSLVSVIVRSHVENPTILLQEIRVGAVTASAAMGTPCGYGVNH
jgi:hypothetical protein